MAKQFNPKPQKVTVVDTKYRKILTEIPNPESVSIIEQMRSYEPISMSGQPLVVWDRAEGFNVFDKHGNCFIDFSSGVVVTNAGHCNPNVQKAILDVVEQGLLHSYCFANEARAKLVKRISELTPIPDNRVFLLTTGGESTECAIKLIRTYGQMKHGSEKIKVITFEDSFHGRTMGAQMAGGSSGDKSWIVNVDKDLQQVPFPNAFKYDWADEENPEYSDEKCFDAFLKNLDDCGIAPNQIAGIMTETFQGGWAQLMPNGFVKMLREYCTKHDILLVFDEVQAGFGRTGKLFGFMHAEITPDMICCGKGISSSLPLSCVVGRADIMDLYGPNKMTSTHSGNPVCSSAALASIDAILSDKMIDNAEKMGEICLENLQSMKKNSKGHIGFVSGKGLVWAVVFTKPGTKEMDMDFAHDFVEKCMQKGLLFFAPVGSGSTIKVCPALMIAEEALKEGLDVMAEVLTKMIV